jgi:hypothetical protein
VQQQQQIERGFSSIYSDPRIGKPSLNKVDRAGLQLRSLVVAPAPDVESTSMYFFLKYA